MIKIKIAQQVLKTITVAFVSCLLLTACDKDNNTTPQTYDVIYVQTNDFNTGQNAVLAYRDKGGGNLEALPGSPFLTGGTGLANPMQILGPADSDYELRLSADGKYILVANSGSNTIAVMLINADGSLTPVAGSPFPSGGQTPVAIDVSGNFVFVVNKSQNPLAATPNLPNYTTFTIDAGGKLTTVPGSTFETTAGTSPANALVSRDGKFLFGTDFLGFMKTPPVGTLRSFVIGAGGTLAPVPGTPYVLPAGAMPDNGALGLWQHPSGNVLYLGIPAQAKVGVYNINSTSGALTFQTAVAAGAAACWLRTNKAGSFMHVLNSGANTVQVYNTSNPALPVSIQTLELKKSGPEYAGAGGAMFKTSEDFSLHYSTSEKILYVVCQHTNKDFSIGNYNYLHSLNVDTDGKLTEDTEPVQLPVANTLRPKGALVLSRTQ